MKKGFTLVELMVLISIIATLTISIIGIAKKYDTDLVTKEEKTECRCKSY